MKKVCVYCKFSIIIQQQIQVGNLVDRNIHVIDSSRLLDSNQLKYCVRKTFFSK